MLTKVKMVFAFLLVAGYGLMYWFNQPQRELAERDFALSQVGNSDAAYRAYESWRMFQPVGWLFVALVVAVIFLPEIIRGCRLLVRAVS